ncbi:MAG: 2Fe-2S iron-sulfur cluster binding domain-containing protein [Cyanobacteria bacterium J06576_12]
MTVSIRFLPDNIVVNAKAGEPLLEVAARAGVHISTGCLMGSCHACEVEVEPNIADPSEESVLACLTAVPKGVDHLDINLMADPTW